MARVRLEDDSPEEIVVVPKKAESNLFQIVDLPSRYALYPKGVKLYGRPFKVKEVKKLSTMNSTNYNSVINEVLSDCISGIDIGEIYLADKLYLLFWLRANTYKNSNFTTEYVCGQCGENNEYVFDVDSFSINYLPENFEFEKKKLLNSEDVLEFDFPKVRDEARIEMFKDANSKKDIDEDTLQLATYIKTINGEKKNLSQICDFLLNLDSPEDYAFIESYIQENEFGVSPEVKVHCKKCKSVNSLPFSFRSDFFVPKYNFR